MTVQLETSVGRSRQHCSAPTSGPDDTREGFHVSQHPDRVSRRRCVVLSDSLGDRLPVHLAAAPVPALLWLAFGLAVVTVLLVNVNIQQSDFHAFYESGEAWREGRPPRYGAFDFPNLNPPIAAPLFAAFTLWPLSTAFWIWTALGAASMVASVWLIVRALKLHWTTTLWIIGAMGATMTAIPVWTLGQVTWFLMYPFTRAWLAGSPIRQGLWLAPVILLKPPVALMALCLPWRVWLTAGVASGSAAGLAVLWQGWAPWAEWLGLTNDVAWIAYTLSVSLWGIVSRWKSDAFLSIRMTDLSVIDVSAVVAAAAALLLIVTRTTGHRRWVLAYWWSLAVSPTGWVYYLPVALGPTLASWPAGRLPGVSLALFTIPIPIVVLWIHFQGPAIYLVNSLYAIAFALAWWAWTRR